MRRARTLRSQLALVPDVPRTTAPGKRFTFLVPPVQPAIGPQLTRRSNRPRSQTAPVPNTPRTTIRKRGFTLPFSRNREQKVDSPSADNGRKIQAPPGVTHPTRPETPALSPVLSASHNSDPSDWKYVISGLIDAIFSDSDKVKAIGQLSGDCAQIFADMIYEVYLCALLSPKTTSTNFRWGF